MESSGADGQPVGWRSLKSPPILFALAVAALVLLLAVDLAGGRDIRLAGLMVAVPALSAVFLGPVAVLVIAVLTIGGITWASDDNAAITTANFPVVMATVLLVGVASVLAARTRQRRERQLAQARKVAEVSQRAVLRPLPDRLGPVTISSMYLAADEEAAIGGDLYAAGVSDRGGTRVLVGDVQGKGLAAVEVAGLLLSAFRRSVRARVSLPALPGFLDRGLRADLIDLEDDTDLCAPDTRPHLPGESDYLERFVTAVVVDIAADGSGLRIANCGHPPPLLIHSGTVHQLFPELPDLPLGLGDLARPDQHIDTHDLALGDILLLYTDGVIEARDADGAFYPLADRLADWTRDTPEALLEDIRADLLRYSASGLGDDIAMVALQRVT
ncbi:MULTISPECIES: PP2C family protein-serine/threonine phosphatase [unclassified Streptomyces]|uniref:PP2C family protein-serine/threonine phosphatase n=1 Tax=unclassified Streptomyces TaxID=2593676 RepID=UPI00344D1A90